VRGDWRSASQGERCDFRHSEAARNNPPCGFWFSGQCRNGVACAYRHPTLPQQMHGLGGGGGGGGSGGSGGGGGKPPCTFFLRGMCTKGAMCAFSHGAINMGRGVTPPGGGGGGGVGGGGAFGMGRAAAVAPSPPLQPAAAWGAAAASHKAPPVSIDAGLPATSPFARSPFNMAASRAEGGGGGGGAAAEASPVRMNACSLSVPSPLSDIIRRSSSWNLPRALFESTRTSANALGKSFRTPVSRVPHCQFVHVLVCFSRAVPCFKSDR